MVIPKTATETQVTQGRWIVLEGLDGSGKSTQLNLLHQKLESEGYTVVATREPGGTPEAEKIRTLLKEEAWLPKTQVLLLLAARLEHWNHVIQPALARGAWVLSDRFWLSTIAYQGYGFQTGEHWIRQIHENVLGHDVLYGPDFTFFLEAPLDITAQRIKGKKPDVFESQSHAFFCRVLQGYQRAQHLLGHKGILIDANQSSHKIAQSIWENVKPFLEHSPSESL